LSNYEISVWHGAWVKKADTKRPVGRISHIEDNRTVHVVWENRDKEVFGGRNYSSSLPVDEVYILPVTPNPFHPKKKYLLIHQEDWGYDGQDTIIQLIFCRRVELELEIQPYVDKIGYARHTTIQRVFELRETEPIVERRIDVEANWEESRV